MQQCFFCRFKFSSQFRFSDENKRFILNFLTLLILLALASKTKNANCKEVDLKIRTDQLLKQLTSVRNQGLMGSLASSCENAESLHGNPAVLGFTSRSQINFSLFRVPKMTAHVAFPSAIEAEAIDQPLTSVWEVSSLAYSVESVKYSMPMGKFGNVGLDLTFSHTGNFSRVNTEGKSINEFPENDLIVTFGYAKKLSDTALGVNAKFVRSKTLDHEGEKTFIRGFVYDIGMIQKTGNFKIGAVLKNISNGLSSPTNSSSVSRFELEKSFYLGAAYYYIPLQELELLVELDLNPPFKHGFRGNLVSELCYRGWLDLRIGYVRDVSDAFILGDETVFKEMDYFELDPLEKIEGLTFGVGLRKGKFGLDVAWTPVYKLRTKSENFSMLMDGNDFSFSLSTFCEF